VHWRSGPPSMCGCSIGRVSGGPRHGDPGQMGTFTHTGCAPPVSDWSYRQWSTSELESTTRSDSQVPPATGRSRCSASLGSPTTAIERSCT
jgi:hypothetical protein